MLKISVNQINWDIQVKHFIVLLIEFKLVKIKTYNVLVIII